VAVHEELGRHDVQPLGDVLADARHRLPAPFVRAGGVLGLVAVLHPAQVRRQRLAPGAARRRLGLGLAFGAQLLERGLQARLVLDERLLEQAALLGAHRLGPGAELPALEARELELELLQPGLTQRDLAVLALQQFVALGELALALGEAALVLGQRAVLLLDVALHLLDERQCLGRQALQVHRRKVAHAEHARHRAAADGLAPSAHAMSTEARVARGPSAQARVITLISSRRCHGSPSTRASNCARVSSSAGDTVAPAGSHAKRPACSRRDAHQMPKPSCTSSFSRVARALANR
jgi:hypothetical protein